MSGEILVGLLFVSFLVVIIVLAAQHAKARREAMFKLAIDMGMQFDPKPGDVHSRFEGFAPFGVGKSRVSSNMISGRSGSLDWTIFDYRYKTGTGDDETTHRYSIIAAELPIHVPPLTIRPEGVFDKLAAMAGFDDINFESEEFSRRYHVKSEDRKLAYDLIHPQAIEYLLANEAMAWQLKGNNLVVAMRGTAKPEQIRQRMLTIEGFVRLLPNYIREERSVTPRQ